MNNLNRSSCNSIYYCRLTAKVNKLEKENLSFRDKVKELEGKIKMNRSYLEEKAGSFNKSVLVNRKIGNNENISVE